MSRSRIVAMIGVGVVLTTICYSIWAFVTSKTRLADEVAFCLGFFNETRIFRIKGKLGDGTDEMTYMRDLADSYAKILTKYDATGFYFGPSARSGHREAEGSLYSSIIAAMATDTKLDMSQWMKRADKCRGTSARARRAVDGVPDRAVPITTVDMSAPSIDLSIKLCVCEGKLRAADDAQVPAARPALNKIATPIGLAHGKLGEECEAARRDAHTALYVFPAEFLQSTRLFEECYVLANSAR